MKVRVTNFGMTLAGRFGVQGVMEADLTLEEITANFRHTLARRKSTPWENGSVKIEALSGRPADQREINSIEAAVRAMDGTTTIKEGSR